MATSAIDAARVRRRRVARERCSAASIVPMKVVAARASFSIAPTGRFDASRETVDDVGTAVLNFRTVRPTVISSPSCSTVGVRTRAALTDVTLTPCGIIRYTSPR